MISKVEAIQRLKKMGVLVADDNSIVTVLIPSGISFETGLKDIRKKLSEIGYDASFCVKQTKEKTEAADITISVEADSAESQISEITEEELNSYIASDPEEQFSMDDDGQFTLGLNF